MECERIHPFFLMYDNNGYLGAFGWTFQGQPLDGDSSIVDWFKLNSKTLFVSSEHIVRFYLRDREQIDLKLYLILCESS